MKAVKIEVKDPVALWHELRNLIDIHYRVAVPQNLPFMKQHPTLYHIYLTLGLESEEVKQEMEKQKGKKPWE